MNQKNRGMRLSLRLRLPAVLVGSLVVQISCVHSSVEKDPSADSQVQSQNGRLFQRPLILGHRGASGRWPEHTLEAYRQAVLCGADYIEPDLVITKDGVLVVRHEGRIDETTDVAQRFPGRQRTKTVDGHKQTGWFVEDFTLKELRSLKAKQRFPFRDQSYNDKFGVPTFEEVLQLALRLQEERGRPVGIYPETKSSSYFRSLGLPLEPELLRLLDKYDLNHKKAFVYIQSFEVNNLKELKRETPLPLIQLIGHPKKTPIDDESKTYGQMLSAVGLKQVAEYASGIGVPKQLIPVGSPISKTGASSVDRGQSLSPASPLVLQARAEGLEVHAYTFRNEKEFWVPGVKSAQEEYQLFHTLQIDGFFTDFPCTARDALRK